MTLNSALLSSTRSATRTNLRCRRYGCLVLHTRKRKTHQT